MKYIVCEDNLSVGKKVCELIQSVLVDATKNNQKITIGVSGGSMAQLIASNLYQLNNIDWGLVHFFYCDERLVPLTHSDSNHFMYENLFYSKINIPRSNIHTVNTNLSPDEAAKDYQKQILSIFGSSGGYPCFDILLLGMGPDGHTCSLFPNHELLYCEDKVVASITDSPKPPPNRVTLTIPVVNKAKKVFFIVCGADKSSMIKSILESTNPSTSLPCTLINPVDGELIWLMDKLAANQIDSPSKHL